MNSNLWQVFSVSIAITTTNQSNRVKLSWVSRLPEKPACDQQRVSVPIDLVVKSRPAGWTKCVVR